MSPRDERETPPDPARPSGAAGVPTATGSPPTERPTGQGLYDLPGLLARIWSVPQAARLATSGSYATRPLGVPPVPPAVERERESAPQPPTPPTPPSPWLYLPFREDPSLPLAAVPSLTLARPPAAPGGLEARSKPVLPEVPVLGETRHYIAWRHPPCRLAYELGRARGTEYGRRPTPVVVEVEEAPWESGGTWRRREPLILPASLPWGTRERTVASLGA